MRKKSFLKAVCLVTCLSILMLSVPGAIASERPVKKIHSKNLFLKKAAMIESFMSFLKLTFNYEKRGTSSGTFSHKYSGKKIKVTGGLLRGMLGDAN